jgi:DNA-directed RNA polymerase subunit alpha
MSILPFQKPNQILMTKSTEFEGSFEFKPLEPGFGVTIGNSLRRVLLSSLSGFAIVGFKIEGIQHEFSTIPGVLEDLTEFGLNLKQIRIKNIAGSESLSEKISIQIKGQSSFTGHDIQNASSFFEVMNPDFVICNIDGNVTLNVEISVQKGRGYVPSEENMIPDMPIGFIPIDSIYTPIKNVQYNIENFRVEQRTDYEKLIMEVTTDGSIHPEEAMKEAAKILIQHFVLFSDENIMPESKASKAVEEVDEGFLSMRKILKTPLADLDLSVRAYNCLKAAEIKTLGELVNYHIDDLLKFRNFGKKSLSELEEFVREKGLHFGMDVARYNINED